MKLKALSVIFPLFIVGLYGATVTDLPTPKAPSELPVLPTTTAAPSTSSETPSSSSTEAPITSTTVSTSTTSTSAPETSSTSTAAPTTTTTVAPKTTTVAPAPVPTTPAPVPGKPAEGKYVVTNGTSICILLQFAAQLNATYTDAEKNVKHKIYNLPGTGDKFKEAKGTCGKTTQFISIEWTEANDTNTLNLTFNLNTTSNEFSLKEAVFDLSTTIVPGSDNRTILYYVGSTFEAPKDKSYHCTRAQVLNLTDSDSIPTNTTIILGTVSVSSVLVDAFHSGDKQEFATAVDCDAINTPDIVPIAVGIALIALVVVVLIAYLVGRRRAAARGYVSM